MRSFDAADLFFYGTIRALKYIRAGRPYPEYGDLATDAASDLTHFRGYHRHRMLLEIESLDELGNALAAAENLSQFIQGTLYPLGDAEIRDEQIELLDEQLNEFETVLKIDLRALPIYILEDKPGYSARQFVVYGKARAVLAKNNQQLLPQFALEDIDHAGKCLIHEQYTAAGFHTMRASENISRIYYEAITGDDR
jgi:hypothetical protein